MDTYDHSSSMIAAPVRGVALIEVLVTMVVIAVGLLAIGATQLSAKRSSFESVQRSQAVQLAQFMMERIRRNPDQLALYHTGDSQALNAACNSNACHADFMAWRNLLARAPGSGLIQPTGCVYIQNHGSLNNTGVVRVVLSWQGQQEIAAPVTGAPPAANVFDPPRCGGNSYSNRGHQVVLTSYVIHPSELRR